MRPAPRLLVLVFALAGMTVLALVGFEVAVGALALIWALVVAVAMADLALTPAARALTLTAELPQYGFVGHVAPLSLTLTGRRLPGSLLLRLTHDPGLQSAEVTAQSGGGTSLATVLPVTILQRGPQRITRIAALYPSRLGLFEIVVNRSLDLTITGLPDVSPILSGAVQLQVLPLLEGLHVMNQRGDGSEFHQLREFVAGMDRRSIDWKRSARMRHLIARETRAERNHQVILCVDTGHLMAQRLGRLTRLDHAINAALALTWAGALAGDNVGFYSFGPRPHRLLPPAPGRAAFAAIRAASAALVQDSAETNHTLGLTTLNSRLKRRSLIIVFSDFADSVTAELLVENLGVLQRQHLILYVALSDPAMQALSEPEDDTLTAIARAVAARRMAQDRHLVLDRLARLGVLCLEATPAALTAALVSRYVAIKAEELV